MTDEEFDDLKRASPDKAIFFSPQSGGRCALCPWRIGPMDRERGEALAKDHAFEETRRKMPDASFHWIAGVGGRCALCEFRVDAMPQEVLEVRARTHLAQAHGQKLIGYQAPDGTVTPLS